MVTNRIKWILIVKCYVDYKGYYRRAVHQRRVSEQLFLLRLCSRACTPSTLSLSLHPIIHLSPALLFSIRTGWPLAFRSWPAAVPLVCCHGCNYLSLLISKQLSSIFFYMSYINTYLMKCCVFSLQSYVMFLLEREQMRNSTH